MQENKNGPSVPQTESFSDIVGYFGFNPNNPVPPDGEMTYGAFTKYEPRVEPIAFGTILWLMHLRGAAVLDEHLAEDIKNRIRSLDPENRWGLSEFAWYNGSVELSFAEPSEDIADRVLYGPEPTADEIRRLAGYKVSKKKAGRSSTGAAPSA